MRLSFIPLLLAATGRPVVGALSGPVRQTNFAKAARCYLDNLANVSENTLLGKLRGSEIGAAPGVVLPFIPDPDDPEEPVFQLRDGCLVYNAYLDHLAVFSDAAHSLRPVLDDAARALIRTQHITSPAGNIFTGGMKEGVFDYRLDRITEVTERLGSPAADGPPFRAAVLIKYAEWLIQPEQNNGTWVADNLWPSIHLDLQWIALHWNQSSYDIWSPPVWGGSYWTAYLQHRALKAGARLASSIGRGDGAYAFESHALIILNYLQTFWNEKEGYMTEAVPTNGHRRGVVRSGLGAAPLAASVLNFDPSLGCDAATFQPCSDRALSTLKVLTDAYRERFSVNHDTPPNLPVLLGRFPEDNHLGGHAQYFSTFNAAEQLFDAAITWDMLGALEVTPVSLKFFRQFDGNVSVGTYTNDTEVYARLLDGIVNYASRTVLLLAQHTPDDFVLPAALDKTNGAVRGERGSARSLVSVLTARHAYLGLMPPSWANGRRLTEESRDTPTPAAEAEPAGEEAPAGTDSMFVEMLESMWHERYIRIKEGGEEPCSCDSE
ncbi:Six-hairpin glycosidase-like protein [Gloeopeniophorella convolvens]|nr:Six-hairpin glycosidase-like protein [Gloeopeniophorella convolvens]